MQVNILKINIEQYEEKLKSLEEQIGKKILEIDKKTKEIKLNRRKLRPKLKPQGDNYVILQRIVFDSSQGKHKIIRHSVNKLKVPEKFDIE